MDIVSVTTIALINIVVGVVLLFFGIKFVRIVVGLMGALIGLWLGGAIAYQANMNPTIGLILALGLAIALGAVGMRFYQFLIRASIAFAVFCAVFLLLAALSVMPIISAIGALVAAGFTFFLIKQLGLIDLAFIIFTAFDGASAILGGIILLTNVDDTLALRHGHLGELFQSSPLWAIPWALLLVSGVWFQYKHFRHTKPAA